MREDFGDIYQCLGINHDKIMHKPSDGQKKIAALNLKNLLAIFTIELDKVLNDGKSANDVLGGGPQSKPVMQQPINPVIIDEPMVIEPDSPMDQPDLGHKKSSFDMEQLDAQALEE